MSTSDTVGVDHACCDAVAREHLGGLFVPLALPRSSSLYSTSPFRPWSNSREMVTYSLLFQVSIVQAPEYSSSSRILDVRLQGEQTFGGLSKRVWVFAECPVDTQRVSPEVLRNSSKEGKGQDAERLTPGSSFRRATNAPSSRTPSGGLLFG